MSHQLALCYRVIKTHDIAPVLAYGITVDDFIAHEAKALWSSIFQYYTDPHTAGSIPSADFLQVQNKSNFMMGDDYPGTSIDGLCYEVRRQRVNAELNKQCVKLSESVMLHNLDPMAPMAEMQAQLARLQALGVTANRDISALQGARSVRSRLESAKRGDDFSKMPWPWEAIQEESHGVQPADYIVFYGRPKSMKTWVLAYLLSWAFHHQKRVLLYTKEMTPDNIYLRTMACILHLAYRELRGAVMSKFRPLNPADEANLDYLIRQMEGDPFTANLITVINGADVGPGQDTVPWLQSKVELYQPDLVFVDGLYLMSDVNKPKSDHERVMAISRALRAMTLKTQIPVIATMQANRKAEGHSQANGSEIAYSDALAQDTTMYARVIADKVSPTVSLVIGGSREFELHGIRIHALPATNFSQHSVLTEKDIQKATEADTGEEEKKEKKAKPAAKSKKEPQPEDTHQANEDYHVNQIQ
jgi:replicative DNA helicase